MFMTNKRAAKLFKFCAAKNCGGMRKCGASLLSPTYDIKFGSVCFCGQVAFVTVL